jgi:hypothetical protein
MTAARTVARLTGPRLIRLVTAQAVWREVLPVAVSFRQRVILMAWRACGNARWLTCAAFRVRVSARPCPAGGLPVHDHGP